MIFLLIPWQIIIDPSSCWRFRALVDAVSKEEEGRVGSREVKMRASRLVSLYRASFNLSSVQYKTQQSYDHTDKEEAKIVDLRSYREDGALNEEETQQEIGHDG